jgi:hypothetical protein
MPQTDYPIRGAAPGYSLAAVLTRRRDGEGVAERMDVLEYGRVIRRQLIVVALGLVITLSLMFLAFVRVTGDGLVARSSPVYGARSVLLVTQAGFPWGRATPPDYQQADAARMEYLAGVYAELAASETVRRRVQTGGRLLSAQSYDVTQLVGSSGRTLPLIAVDGKSTSAAGAVTIANAVAAALRRYIIANQNSSRVPARERVELRVVTRAEKAGVLQGVKLTTPIMLFLLGSVVTLVVAFTRDNVLRQRAAREAASPPLEPVGPAAVQLESAPEEPAVRRRAARAHESFSNEVRGTVDGP